MGGEEAEDVSLGKMTVHDTVAFTTKDKQRYAVHLYESIENCKKLISRPFMAANKNFSICGLQKLDFT
jgi:hypothetical protein